MVRQRQFFALLTGLFVLVGGFSSGTALAAPVTGTPTGSGTGNYCVGTVVPTGAVSQKSGFPIARLNIQCFATQPEADATLVGRLAWV